MASKPIGELNGRWAFLLKLTLVLIPGACGIFCAVTIPWVKWVNDACYSIEAHEADYGALTQDLHNLEDLVTRLPSTEWVDRIKTLEEQMRRNSDEHARIMVGLEQIKTKLGVEHRE